MFLLPVLSAGGADALLGSFSWSLGELPVATSVVDPHGRLVRVNAAFCELLGRTEGELLGWQVSALLVPPVPSGAGAWQQVRDGVQRQDVERWRCAEGDPVELVVVRLGVAGQDGACWVLQQAVAVDTGVPVGTSVQQAVGLGRLWTGLARGTDAHELGELTVGALVDRLGGTATVFVPDLEDAGAFEAVALRAGGGAGQASLARSYALHPLRADEGLIALGLAQTGPLLLPTGFEDATRVQSPYREWLTTHPMGAALIAPLRVDGRAVGVLGLARPRGEQAYDEADGALVAKLAERLAPALERAQHRRLEHWTARRSAALAAVAHACERALGTPDSVLPAAARAVSDELGLPCLIWIGDEAAGRLGRLVLHAHGRHRSRTLEQSPTPDALAERVLRDGRVNLAEPAELRELARDYLVLQEEQFLTPDSVVYGVRMEARGSVIGGLCVHDATGPLSVEQRRLVDALAERVALALDNAVLLDVALERGRQQQALAEIGAATLADGLDGLFDLVVRTVAAVLDLPACGVLALAPDGAFVLLAGSASGAPVGTRIVPAAGHGLAVAARTGRPVVVPDYRLTDVVDEPGAAELWGALSGVVLPVHVDGRVWGVLTMHSPRARRFSAAEVTFFGAVTNVVAGALQRASIARAQAHEATHDALTGLPNRVLLREHLVRALRAADDRRPVVALLLLDLDDFKDVNDSLGHAAGDDVLAELAVRLSAAVGPGPLVARLGGDEFAVCLAGCDNELEAIGVAARVISVMAAPFFLPGLDVTLTMSVGVAVSPAHGTDPDRLLRCADMAMYRAKSARSGWALYDPGLDRERAGRLALLAELRTVLQDGALLVHYQPLVDLRTGAVREVEALVRWRHPLRGLLTADAFVSLAEQSGLIDDLTLQVARQAAAQAEVWRAQGTPCRISVNVSPVVLRRAHVWHELREVFTGADGALLMEVTESALVDATAQAAVAGFAEAGIDCAVDDFGSGYAALSSLKTLAVTRLKLDREFTTGVDRDHRAALVIGGAVALAHSLGLDVVAEGVENEASAQALRDLGVDIAQGYLYSHPVAAAEVRFTGSVSQVGATPPAGRSLGGGRADRADR